MYFQLMITFLAILDLQFFAVTSGQTIPDILSVNELSSEEIEIIWVEDSSALFYTILIKGENQTFDYSANVTSPYNYTSPYKNNLYITVNAIYNKSIERSAEYLYTATYPGQLVEYIFIDEYGIGWLSVDFAETYNVYVELNSTIGSPVVFQDTDGHYIPVALSIGDYYRVIILAENAYGSGPELEEVMATAVIDLPYIEPLTTAGYEVTLEWEPLTNALSYTLKVYDYNYTLFDEYHNVISPHKTNVKTTMYNTTIHNTTMFNMTMFNTTIFNTTIYNTTTYITTIVPWIYYYEIWAEYSTGSFRSSNFEEYTGAANEGYPYQISEDSIVQHGILPTSLYISWTKPGKGIVGEANAYLVYLSSLNTEFLYLSNNTNITIKNLEPGMWYNVIVSGVNENGPGINSSSVLMRTDYHTQITGFFLKNNTIYITWTESKNCEAYKVFYSGKHAIVKGSPYIQYYNETANPVAQIKIETYCETTDDASIAVFINADEIASIIRIESFGDGFKIYWHNENATYTNLQLEYLREDRLMNHVFLNNISSSPFVFNGTIDDEAILPYYFTLFISINDSYTGPGTTYLYYNDPCDITCAGNATCVFNRDLDEHECICNQYFTGNGLVECFVFCNGTTINEYYFPDAYPGYSVYSNETCESGRSIASVSCNLYPVGGDYVTSFEDFTAVECNVTIAESISQVNTSSPVEVENGFSEIQILTENAETLEEEDVEEVISFFADVVEAEIEITKKTWKDCVLTGSHLSEYFRTANSSNKEKENEEKNSLRENLSILARRTDLSGRTPSGDPVYESKSPDIASKITDVETPKELLFSPGFYNNTDNPSSLFYPVLVEIPDEALSVANDMILSAINNGDDHGSGSSGSGSSDEEPIVINSTTIRVVFLVFRDSTLFPSSTLVDWVTTVELGDRTDALQNIELLNSTVEIVQTHFEDNMLDRDEFYSCSYWDTGESVWSDGGCRLVEVNATSEPLLSDDGCEIVDTNVTIEPPICECNHLTSFAALILVSKNISVYCGVNTLPTGIGCLVSIGGLTVTFICNLVVKKLRKRPSTPIIMNLCASLIISYLLFILGIDPQLDKSGRIKELQCTGLAISLQYFLLCSWCWMAVYAHQLWFKIVGVMRNYGKRYNICQASFFSYGVSIAIVSVNVGITIGYIDKENENECEDVPSSYRSIDLCWLTGHSLVFGFITPVAIILLYNTVVFIVVISKLTCCKKRIRSTRKDPSITYHVLNAVSFTTTLGVSWSSGFFMLLPESGSSELCVASWIFCIFNSLQGILMFLLLCVRPLYIGRPSENPAANNNEAINQGMMPMSVTINGQKSEILVTDPVVLKSGIDDWIAAHKKTDTDTSTDDKNKLEAPKEIDSEIKEDSDDSYDGNTQL